MKIGICETILALNPTAQVSCSDNDINRIEWLDNTPVISNDIILAKQSELQVEEDNRLVLEQQRKQSAIAKLKAIGLTDEEINSLLGV